VRRLRLVVGLLVLFPAVALFLALSPSPAFAFVAGTGSTGQVLFDSYATAAESLDTAAVSAGLLADIADPGTIALLSLSGGFFSEFNATFTNEVKDCDVNMFGSHPGWPDFSSVYFSSSGAQDFTTVNFGDSPQQQDTPDDVFCDPALVFPALYSPGQIAQEPWQGAFCSAVQVLDGAGEFPPLEGTSESAVSTSNWAWIYKAGLPLSGAQETQWLDEACPPSWLQQVYGQAYTDNTAGYQPAPTAVGTVASGVPDAAGDSAVCDEVQDTSSAPYQSGGVYFGAGTLACNFGLPQPGVTVTSITATLDAGDGQETFRGPGYGTPGSGSGYLVWSVDSSSQSLMVEFGSGNYGGPYAPPNGCDPITITYSDGEVGAVGCGTDGGTFTENNTGDYSTTVPSALVYPATYFPGGEADQTSSSSTTLAAAPTASPAVQQAPHAAPAGAAISTGDSTSAPAGTLTPDQSAAQSGVTDVSDVPDTNTLTSEMAAVGNAGDQTMRWSADQVVNGMQSLSLNMTSLTGDLENVLEGGLSGVGLGVTALTGAVVDLPALIAEGITNGLETLFEPSTTSVDELTDQAQDTFPISWVATGVTDVQTVTGAAHTGVGGSDCGPYVGFPSTGVLPGFGVRLPSPDTSCPGNGAGGVQTAQDKSAGSLFGYRVIVRDLLALVVVLGFILRLIRSAPWSPGEDDLSPSLASDGGGPE
jgi:hypothetical protein